MVELFAESRVEAQPKADLQVTDFDSTSKCCTDAGKSKLDIDLGNRLINNEQMTMNLMMDACTNHPELPFDQAIVKALEDGKENIAKEQAKLKDAGLKPPPLGQMMIDSGLVTKGQVDEALKAQDELKAKGLPAPRIGDMLVNLLKTHIDEQRVRQAAGQK